MGGKRVTWKEKPAAEDFAAALNFLSLVFPTDHSQKLVRALRGARTSERTAKDLLRASGLPLLDCDEVHVADDLKKLRKGKPLSPILLVQGNLSNQVPLTIADGYHRICAVCHYDEDAAIRCRMVQ